MFSLNRPLQPVIISTMAEVEILGKIMRKENLSGCFNHMLVSEKPLIYACSLHKDRFSNKLIEKSGCFAVNFISARFKEKFLICSERRGEHVDKFKLCGFDKEECQKIECVQIKEASAVLECEVIKVEEIGDFKVYYGNVVGITEKNKEKRLFLF